jgi:hypothetical protein
MKTNSQLSRSLQSLAFYLLSLVILAPMSGSSQICTPAPSGLVAWYRGEGNANDSAGTANGTFFSPAYGAGEVGQAFSFNGSSSFMWVVGASGLNFTSNSPMSIELWAYRRGAQTSMNLLGKRGSACGAIQYQISLSLPAPVWRSIPAAVRWRRASRCR